MCSVRFNLQLEFIGTRLLMSVRPELLVVLKDLCVTASILFFTMGPYPVA